MATRRNVTTTVEPTTVGAEIAPGASPVIVEKTETTPDTTPAEVPTTTEKTEEKAPESTPTAPAPIVPVKATSAAIDPMQTVIGRKEYVDALLMKSLAESLEFLRTLPFDEGTIAALLSYGAARYNWMAGKTGYAPLDKHNV